MYIEMYNSAESHKGKLIKRWAKKILHILHMNLCTRYTKEKKNRTFTTEFVLGVTPGKLLS